MAAEAGREHAMTDADPTSSAKPAVEKEQTSDGVQLSVLTAPPPPPLPQSALASAMLILANSDPSLPRAIEEGMQDLGMLRKQIVHSSRQNFILERELDAVDEKIKLLIRNRVTVQEVISASLRLQNSDGDTTRQHQLGDRKPLYERLLYLLQSHPEYFARLARVVSGREVQMFVQTVVFDMYGDQYDTREERLLLSLFGIMLRHEFSLATHMGNLLRANTAVTQMLSAYSRRGLGLSVLKDILAEPLDKITSEHDLDLELNPITVFNEIVKEYETVQGQPYPHRQNLSSEECAEHPDVVAKVEPRRRHLMSIAADILSRICQGVDSVPYGMRWICMQLRKLAIEHFPDADKYRVGSLIGGYIYLRFFNPVIVTPDAINFIPDKVSKKMRRNLILIAKLLQNLSNGMMFGDKERYMIPCNQFLQDHRDVLADYFDNLVAVDDLDTELVLDRYLKHTSTRSTQVQISFNQVYTIHSLLERHCDLVCEADTTGELRCLIQELGHAPELLKTCDNHMVGLELAAAKFSKNDVAEPAIAPRRSMTISPADVQTQRSHPLYKEAARKLVEMAKELPLELCDNCGDSLRTLLRVAADYAKSHQCKTLAETSFATLQLLNTLETMQILPYSISHTDLFDSFLDDVSKSCRVREQFAEELKKKRQMVEEATAAIAAHHSYLAARLELYRQYLDNVRQGRSNAPDTRAQPKVKNKANSFKISPSELETMGVIVSVDPDVRKTILRKTSFTFSEVDSHTFKVTAHYRKARAPMKPIMLDLEVLLDMQANNQTLYKVPSMILNVNLLIHLINSRFLAKK